MNWGKCEDGSSRIGCGPQEEYYNCADISILPSETILRRNIKEGKQMSGSAFQYLQNDSTVEPIVPIFDFNEGNNRMSNKAASGEVQVRKDTKPAFPSASIGKVPKPKGIILPYLGEITANSDQHMDIGTQVENKAKENINPVNLLNRFKSTSEFKGKILSRTKRATSVTPNPATQVHSSFSLKKTTKSFSGSNAHSNLGHTSGRLGSMKGQTGVISPPLAIKTGKQTSPMVFKSSSSSSSSTISRPSPLTSVKWSASSLSSNPGSSSSGFDSSVPIRSGLASRVMSGVIGPKTVHAISFVVNNTHSGIDKQPHSAVSLALRKLKKLVKYVKEGGNAETIQTVQVTNTPSGAIRKVIRTEIRKKNMGVTPSFIAGANQGSLKISAKDFLNGKPTSNRMSSFSGSVGVPVHTVGGSTEVNVNQRFQANSKTPSVSMKITNTATKHVTSNGHQKPEVEVQSIKETKSSIVTNNVIRQSDSIKVQNNNSNQQMSLASPRETNIDSQNSVKSTFEKKMEQSKPITAETKSKVISSPQSISSSLSSISSPQSMLSNAVITSRNTRIDTEQQVTKSRLSYPQTVVVPSTDNNYVPPSSMSGPSLIIAGESLSSRPADLGYNKMSQVTETEAKQSFLKTQQMISAQRNEDLYQSSVNAETNIGKQLDPVVISDTVSKSDRTVSKPDTPRDRPMTNVNKFIHTVSEEKGRINTPTRQFEKIEIRSNNNFSPSRDAKNSFSARHDIAAVDKRKSNTREILNANQVFRNVKSEAIEKILREKQEPNPSRKIAHKMASDSKQVRPDTTRTKSVEVNTTSVRKVSSKPSTSSSSFSSSVSSFSVSSSSQASNTSSVSSMIPGTKKWQAIPNQGNLKIETTKVIRQIQSQADNKNIDTNTPPETSTMDNLDVITIRPNDVTTVPTVLEISSKVIQDPGAEMVRSASGIVDTTLPPQIPPSTNPPDSGSYTKTSQTQTNEQIISSPILIKGSINIGGTGGAQWGISNGLDGLHQNQNLVVDGLNQGLGLEYGINDPSYQINFNLPSTSQKNVGGNTWIETSGLNTQQMDSLLMDQTSSLASQSSYSSMSNNVGEQFLTADSGVNIPLPPGDNIPLPPGETGMMIDGMQEMQNADLFVPYDTNMMTGVDQFGTGSSTADISFTQGASLDGIPQGAQISSNFGGQALSSGFDAGIIPSGMDHTLLRMTDTSALDVGPVLSAGGQVAHDSAFGLGFVTSLPETTPPPTTTTTTTTTTAATTTPTRATTTTSTTQTPTTSTEQSTTTQAQPITTTRIPTTTTETTTKRPTTTTQIPTTQVPTTTTEATTTLAPTTQAITRETIQALQPLVQTVDFSVSKTSSVSETKSSSIGSNTKVETSPSDSSYTIFSVEEAPKKLTPPPAPVIKQVIVSTNEQIDMAERPIPELKAVSAQHISSSQTIEGKSAQKADSNAEVKVTKDSQSSTLKVTKTADTSNAELISKGSVFGKTDVETTGTSDAQIKGISETSVKTSYETSGRISTADESLGNAIINKSNFKSVDVERKITGKNTGLNLKTKQDNVVSKQSKSLSETVTDTKTEKSKSTGQDPNAILANMFKALTDIMLKVQMRGKQTFPYSTDQSQKILMTNAMAGAPTAITLEKANTQTSASSSSTSVNVESKSVSASEVVQGDVRKDKIATVPSESQVMDTSAKQSASISSESSLKSITVTQSPSATQLPPQTEAPAVEASPINTGDTKISNLEASSFSMTENSAMDMTGVGNIDGQAVGTSMIDSTGIGNMAPEWGNTAMTGNVDLMMDTANLGTASNNVWDTTYVFDNTATGVMDVGTGPSGSSWDTMFVDSVLPTDATMTGSSAGGWDASFNTENTGTSTGSSFSSSKTVSSSSKSISSSSSRRGDTASKGRVQMRGSSVKQATGQESARPIIQPLTTRPTPAPIRRVALIKTTPAPPPTPSMRRITTTPQPTTPWDASFVNLRSLSGFQISGGGSGTSSQNTGASMSDSTSQRSGQSFNNFDNVANSNTVDVSNSFNSVDNSKSFKRGGVDTFNSFDSTNALQSGRRGSFSASSSSMMQSGSSSNVGPVVPTESSQAAWGLGVEASSNRMNTMNTQTAFNAQMTGNNNKWNNFLEVGSSRFDIPVNVPPPTTTTMAPTTTTPLPTEPPVIIDVNDLTPESVDPISR